jgi:hypothetical protein
MLHTIGMVLQIVKDALPYPNTPLFGMEYYGLKGRVVKFSILKEFMTHAFQIRVGSVFPTSNAPLAAMKFNIPDVIPNSDCRYDIQSNIARTRSPFRKFTS